ncbi:MAG: hypothetical protein AAF206_20425 [Bacteroidota bacterium]
MKTLICLLLLGFTYPAFSQNQFTYPAFETQRRQLTVYNLGIGAVMGGVGALLNKKPDQKAGKVFLKGVGQGILGSWVRLQGKRMLYGISRRQSFAMGWPAKIVYTTGNSILINAASNRNFWESWSMSFGPLRLELDQRNQFRPRAKLLPGALVGLIWSGTLGRFQLGTTLVSGVPYFLSDGPVRFGGRNFAGLAVGNSFTLDRRFADSYELFSHEYIHTFQYEDYMAVNHFFDKPLATFRAQRPKLKKMNRWLYLDVNWGTFYSLYFLEGYQSFACYYNNFFELEAEHFATSRGQRICE